VFTVSSLNGPLSFGQFVDVNVTFALAGAPATHTGSLLIQTNPSGIEGSPATVTLSASTPTP